MELLQRLNTLKYNVDVFFLITMASFVFLMQCGFAFLEAGCVRSKNTINILIKNLLDCLLGSVTYWVLGWAVAYGKNGNGFIGGSNYFGLGMEQDDYPLWFFKFVFAATAATIVSGAIAERCQFVAYLIYSVCITGWVYPVVSHWAWSTDGWMRSVICQRFDGASKLNINGVFCFRFEDFAGSGVVHIFAATCALIGCYIIGPRTGRFVQGAPCSEIQRHSLPLTALGGFILMFGFLAFNGGSQLSITNPGDGAIVGKAIVNTIIGGSGGGLAVLFYNKLFGGKKWSYLLTLNGALAGMISMCAGCDAYMTWSSLFIGTMGGSMFLIVGKAMNRYQLDDPIDAVAVHGGGGMVGALMLPFFSFERGILWNIDHPLPWIQLGVNCLCIICIIAWAGIHSILIFGGLNYFGLLRIDLQTELKGSDITKHGEDAYQVNDWMKENCDSSTQTIVTTNAENTTAKDEIRAFYRQNPTIPYNLERDYVILDNFQALLKSCKV